ncbi:chromo (CHRromatin organization MOdifier) domain domain-containing protein [Purpureocillium lilacinum]|uniref:Chromo (CHRromatin organization MOdifier) domain domain-containing protein n=1 Tax=Purpureocillium lilacinum TaxID=33203 RepID=A0A179G9J5_PURLI|nr:chromo (CHRromatin organization MOdifier) domain domain-containing protein [Purpureocillium lilacinum]
MAPAVFNTLLNTLFSPQKTGSSAGPRTPSDDGDARPPLSPKAKTTSKKNQKRSPAGGSNASTPVAKSTGKVQKRQPASKPAPSRDSLDGPSTPTRAPSKRAAVSSPAKPDAPAVTTPVTRPKSPRKAAQAADKPAETTQKEQKKQQTQPQPPKKRQQQAATPAEDAMDVDERHAEPNNKDDKSNKQDDDDDDDDEFSFKRFSNWRWATNGTSIEIEVEWAAGDKTWEPEANLHEDVPDALLGYWEEKGGRPVSPTDPDVFDILRVRDHSPDRKQLLVEWVGFGPKDATWVSRRSVERTAPSVVSQYMKGLSKEKAPRKQAKAVAKTKAAAKTKLASSTSSGSTVAKPAAKAKAAARVGSATGSKSEGAAPKRRGRPAAQPAKRRPGVAYRK